MALTDRQINILKALIEDYIETAEPVSSDALDKKYNLGVSPATIRNEMASLAYDGFIKKPHVSAGRVPTPMGLKFYIQNLLETRPVSVAQEVSVKEHVWDHRQEVDKLITEATSQLARMTNSLAVTISPDQELNWSGVANILDFPEFWDIDLTHALLALLDDASFWQKLTDQVHGEARVSVLLGDDFGNQILEPCGFVFTKFSLGAKEYTIGIVGPGRCPYRKIIPLVDYFGRLISEIGQRE
jgi:heat-inducible transcriptional repressor